MKQKQIIWGFLFAIILAAFDLRMIGIENIASGLPAIFSTLAVLGIFLLAGEIFQDYAAGLIGAYLFAFSYWAISFSRMESAKLLLPIILIFSFYFLFQGLRTRQIHSFIISGFIFGFGFFEHAMLSFFPFMFVTILLSLAITSKKLLSDYRKHILVFIIATTAIASSAFLGLFHINTENIILSPKSSFYVQLFDPLIIISFLAGLFYTIVKFLHISRHHFKKRDANPKNRAYIFLLAWFFSPILFRMFFGTDAFSGLDLTTILLPVIMIISIIPFLWIVKKYHSFGHAYRIFTVSILTAVFMFIAIYNIISCFVFLK